MSQLSEFDKGRIIELYEDGYCIRAISRILGFSKSTIHLWVKRMLNEGHVTCRPRSGRPRTTTEDQDVHILRCSGEDPYRTSKEIKNILKLPISRSTIRRRLNRLERLQKTETSIQLENDSLQTVNVAPLCSVDISVPDVSGNRLFSEALTTAQDDDTSDHDRLQKTEISVQLANESHLTVGVEPLCNVDISIPDIHGSYSLWEALTTGRDDVASFLVRNGADTDCWSEGPEGFYQTLLHRAIDDKNESAARFLIQNGCDVNASRRHGPGGRGGEEVQNQQSPLHMCCKWGLKTVVQTLTEHGAAINCQDTDGKTPLHIAIENQHDAIISLLLCHPELDLTLKDKAGLTPFAAAVTYRNNKAAKTILTLMPTAAEQIDDCDAHRRTALHVAAGAGHVAIVSILLQNGADANALDSDGNNALHIACREGQLGAAQLLLTESQLDAEAVNLKGRNPLHELARASKDAAADIAELFIERVPCYPVDKPDLDGNTALLLAYMKGNKNLCHMLVKSGASLGVMNKDGITIFDYQFGTKQLLHSLLNSLFQLPTWTEGEICLECGIKFEETIHKFHCHHCGRILCSKCSERHVPILKFGLDKPVRVCSVCFNVLQGNR